MSSNQEIVRTVFQALAVESLAPVSPERLVEATAGSLGAPFPDAPMSDVATAERWIVEHVAGRADPFPALQAMARAAADPHALLAAPPAGVAMMALVAGAPSTDPGLVLHRLGDGRIVIGTVVRGGAAAAADLRVGDVVFAVGGVRPAHGMDVAVMIMGTREGDAVPIEVERSGARKTIELRLQKATLPLGEWRIVEPGLGLIALRWIAVSQDPERDTATIVRRALTELARDGAKAILLDLRGNHGGYGVSRVASVLTDGDPIVIYRHPGGEEEIASRSGARSPVRVPLAVLVDEETTSSAEMIALCLQQHVDACIVGRPTGGALNVPIRKVVGEGYVLMVPGSIVLGPRTHAPNAGMRVMPDVIAPRRTVQDLIEGRDPQRDAARDQFARAV